MALRAPAFWRGPPDWRARLLAPLGRLYGAVAARRMARRGARVDIPVICVGNFTLGGAGKTPTVMALARILSDMGETPVIVSRGYGGFARGPLLVDAAKHGAEEVGDEPMEIAARARVIVARDRVAGARAAIAAGASLVLLDDGMQNPSLAKDATLAVIDGEAGFGNGFCFPAGPLRAPVGAQLAQAQAALVIGSPLASIGAALGGLRRFTARLVLEEETAKKLAGARLFAFAGIGRPEKFFATLAAAGLEVAATRAFADHHPFDDAELAELALTALRAGLTPVTTAKDFARIGAARAGRFFADRLQAAPARLVFDDEAAVRSWLVESLEKARRP